MVFPARKHKDRGAERDGRQVQLVRTLERRSRIGGPSHAPLSGETDRPASSEPRRLRSRELSGSVPRATSVGAAIAFPERDRPDGRRAGDAFGDEARARDWVALAARATASKRPEA